MSVLNVCTNWLSMVLIVMSIVVVPTTMSSAGNGLFVKIALSIVRKTPVVVNLA